MMNRCIEVFFIYEKYKELFIFRRSGPVKTVSVSVTLLGDIRLNV